ncbi:MAG TPA: hypothetical protein VF544_14725 [Pyrinomonadaceae bacterium]|jgi:hypothetical protein
MEDEMSKKNPTAEKDTNLRIAKITALQAIAVALITAIATAVPVYFAGKQIGKAEPPVEQPTPPVDVITREELTGLIKNAQRRIWASGFALVPIDPKILVDKVKNNSSFDARIVLVHPSSKVVCQRDKDEIENKTPGHEKLKWQVRSFVEYRKVASPKEQYKIKLSDIYPTMGVYILDNDVCVHFYPYGAFGSESPVIRFTNIKDERENFFIKHFNSVFDKAVPLTDEVEYKNPCEPGRVRT